MEMREAGRFGGDLRRGHKSHASEHRRRPVLLLIQDSRVGHGADGALVAGNPGISGVDVDDFNYADKRNEKDAEQRERP